VKEAMFWTALDEGKVRCDLCRLTCHISNGQRGHCGVRENRGGILYTLNYGLAVANNVDPIEKKPLFHLCPGSRSYSIATVGCNFRCLHCQNASISQVSNNDTISGTRFSPKEIVEQAITMGCKSIAYTYTEPTIFYEYAYDTAYLAYEAGLKNVFVTNGYIAEKPLRKLAPVLSAANIDLKGFSSQFYHKVCGANLDQVLESLCLYRQLGIWIEITTLIIPGYNDDRNELVKLAAFIVDKLGVDTPWHVTGFYPTYKLLNAPPTPANTLRMAQQIGYEAGLHYVYVGNTANCGGEDTICHNCGNTLISRCAFEVTKNNLLHGKCQTCGTQVAGIEMDCN